MKKRIEKTIIGNITPVYKINQKKGTKRKKKEEKEENGRKGENNCMNK